MPEEIPREGATDVSEKCVLAIAAHPDDIEFLMSGTMLRLRSAGFELHYFNVASGCCGSMIHDRATTAAIRLKEAKRAAERMGAEFHPPVAHDLDIFYERETLARVSAVVREVAPDIVLTHAPSDYMEDHMNTCRLAVTAAFVRGMPNFPVDPPRKVVSKPVTLYHAQPFFNHDPLGKLVQPHLFVNVADLEEEKAALLSCHVSQKQWLDETQGQDSYLETMKRLDAQVGHMSGVFEYAEGWRRHLHVGLCQEYDDPLRVSLEGYTSMATA